MTVTQIAQDYDFNPRSREGSDHTAFSESHSLLISIRAPARGATRAWRIYSRSKTYFNPRSREGSDAHRTRSHSPQRHFNPRSREGSDWLPPAYLRPAP